MQIAKNFINNKNDLTQ